MELSQAELVERRELPELILNRDVQNRGISRVKCDQFW